MNMKYEALGNILITGGSGFLGRGIMHHMPQYKYIVYSRDEFKQDLCRRMFPDAIYVLGDVKDVEHLKRTLTKHSVSTIIHTAAMKYIPEAENNALECIEVNVQGSKNVCWAASNTHVSRVVGISTDKACMPVNVYGASKMLMERIFDEFAKSIYGVHYTLARYGNVIGSTGSVIPLFERQCAKDGKITLTDPYMTRFWISIEEAVMLIKYALTAPTGTIVVPKATAMTMQDLAQALAEGLPIDIIGPRPGEKTHESMIHGYEAVRARDCGDHYLILPIGHEPVGEPFVLSSQNPHRWLNAQTLYDYMDMAAELDVSKS